MIPTPEEREALDRLLSDDGAVFDTLTVDELVVLVERAIAVVPRIRGAAMSEDRDVSGVQVKRYYVRHDQSACPACGCPDTMAEQYVGWFEDRPAPAASPPPGTEENDG